MITELFIQYTTLAAFSFSEQFPIRHCNGTKPSIISDLHMHQARGVCSLDIKALIYGDYFVQIDHQLASSRLLACSYTRDPHPVNPVIPG